MADNTRPVSKRMRFEILRRDQHRCRYCGATAQDCSLTVDHLIPRALGGTDSPDNLVTACFNCNSGKASIAPDSPIVDEVNLQAERLRHAFRRVTETDRERRSDYFMALDELVCNLGQEWIAGNRIHRRTWELPSDASASWIRFYELGLSEIDIVQAMSETFMRAFENTDGWRYFCAICWNIIRDRNQMAIESADSEVAS